MLFIETRGNDGQHSASFPFSEAILSPMASFGGLYSPQTLPELTTDFLQAHVNSSYKQLAFSILSAFDVDINDEVLNEALALYDHFDDTSNPVPVVRVNDELYVSELYHGVTRAFKDMVFNSRRDKWRHRAGRTGNL